MSLSRFDSKIKINSLKRDKEHIEHEGEIKRGSTTREPGVEEDRERDLMKLWCRCEQLRTTRDDRSQKNREMRFER